MRGFISHGVSGLSWIRIGMIQLPNTTVGTLLSFFDGRQKHFRIPHRYGVRCGRMVISTGQQVAGVVIT